MINETEENAVMEPSVYEENSIPASKADVYTLTNYDDRSNRAINEGIAAIKDYRLNIKRVIAADIASTAQLLKQNGILMEAYGQQLQREDISETARDTILNRMAEISNSTALAHKESCEFQANLLEQSRKLPRKIIGFIVLIAVTGIGIGVGVKVFPKRTL